MKKSFFGNYYLYSSSQKKRLSMDWKTFSLKAQEAGAGEIVLNSVDADGVQNGMNVELIKKASKLLKVPLIGLGGVGSLSDIKEGVRAGASAIGVGSYFVFKGKHRAVLISYPKYNELESLFGDLNE